MGNLGDETNKEEEEYKQVRVTHGFYPHCCRVFEGIWPKKHV
jgi:hypothetical protein